MDDAIEEWRLRAEAFLAQAPPPRWSRGVVVDRALVEHYERFLPIAPYLSALRKALMAVLPDAGWMPRVVAGGGQLRSVCDLWTLLPDRWSHQLAWGADAEYWAVACALAAPARFGTRSNRYPEQRPLFAAGDYRRVLDLGCGTGQGTWELSGLLGEGAEVVGVTLEPLEVWMAQHRELPHLRLTADQAGYPACPDRMPSFVVADVCGYLSDGDFDLIVCNGLAGGPAMHEDAQLADLWRVIDRAAGPSCTCVLGNRFHAGYARANEQFVSLAPFGWAASRLGESSILLHRLPQ